VLLARQDVDPDQQTHHWSTPLLLASEFGHFEVVELLLTNPKVDPNKAKINGDSSVGMALCEKHPNTATVLLLDSRADVEKPGRQGRTPLHWAAFHGYTEAVKILLEVRNSKVDVAVKDKDGKTALELASKEGHEEIIELLVLQEQKDID